mgnify:CR=1 FL=1
MQKYSKREKRDSFSSALDIYGECLADEDADGSFPYSSKKPIFTGKEFWNPEACFLYRYFDCDYPFEDFAEFVNSADPEKGYSIPDIFEFVR